MKEALIEYQALDSDKNFQKNLLNNFDINSLSEYYSTIDNIEKYYFFYSSMIDILRLKKLNVHELTLAISFLIDKNEHKLSLFFLLTLRKYISKEKIDFINYNIGIQYYKLKKFKLSYKYFNKIEGIKEKDLTERFGLDKSFLLTINKEKNKSIEILYNIIKQNYDNYEAYYELASVGDGNDRDFILKHFENHQINLTNLDLDRLYFAFSKIYELRKDFEKAYDYFQKGNLERSKKIFFNKNKIINEINFFQKNKHLWDVTNEYEIDSEKILNNFNTIHIFIVGLPRSGSTLIEQMLASHPQFKSYGEIDTFSKYFKFFFTKINMDNIRKNENKALLNYAKFYNSNFPKSKNIKFLINKMPFNFYSIGFIKKCLPNSIIIYSKRNFEEIAVSLLKNYFSDLNLNFCYSEQDILDFIGIFKNAMEEWNRILKTNAIYEIEYEDLILNPSSLKNFFKYHNIRWDDCCLNFNAQQNLTDTSSIHQVDKKIYTSSIKLNSIYQNKLENFLTKIKNL